MKKIPQYISEQIYLFSYIILIGIGLVVAVIMLSSVVSQMATSNNGESSDLLELNQSMINRINNLKTSDNVSTAPDAPSGRTNPFSE